MLRQARYVAEVGRAEGGPGISSLIAVVMTPQFAKFGIVNEPVKVEAASTCPRFIIPATSGSQTLVSDGLLLAGWEQQPGGAGHDVGDVGVGIGPGGPSDERREPDVLEYLGDIAIAFGGTL